MDETPNQKGKIIIDLFLVAAAVFFMMAALKFSAPETVSAKPGDIVIRCTIELKEKQVGFHKKVEMGVTLYDNVKGYIVGKIIDVYALPYREPAFDEDTGIIRSAPIDGLESVYIVVETTAQISETTTSIGQYDIAVGKEVFVKTKRFAGKGFVTDITRMENEEG